MTLALLNQHAVSEFRPIVNNGDWKHVEGMHQEEEEGKRPNVPWALTAVEKQKQFTTVEVF